MKLTDDEIIKALKEGKSIGRKGWIVDHNYKFAIPLTFEDITADDWEVVE